MFNSKEKKWKKKLHCVSQISKMERIRVKNFFFEFNSCAFFKARRSVNELENSSSKRMGIHHLFESLFIMSESLGFGIVSV